MNVVTAGYDFTCYNCGSVVHRGQPNCVLDGPCFQSYCSESCAESFKKFEELVRSRAPYTSSGTSTCRYCGKTISKNTKYWEYELGDFCSGGCIGNYILQKQEKAEANSINPSPTGKKEGISSGLVKSSAKFEVKQEVSNPVESNEPEFEMYKGKILGYFKPGEMYHCYHCYKYFTWEGNKYQVYWNPKKSEWHIFCSPKHRELFANAPALGKILTGKRYKMHERSRNFQNKSKELSGKISKAGEAASGAMQNKIINGRFAKGLIKLYTKMGIIPDENKRNEMQEKNPPTIGDYLKNFGKNFGKAFKSPFGKKKDE